MSKRKKALAVIALALAGAYVLWLLMAPFMSLALGTDFSHPLSAHWTGTGNAKTAVVEFDYGHALDLFKKQHFHAPFPSNGFLCFFMGFALAICWCEAADRMDRERWITEDGMIGIFVGLAGWGAYLVVFTLVRLLMDCKGIEAALHKRFSDGALASAVIKEYGGGGNFIIIGIVLTIITCLIVPMIYEGIVDIVIDLAKFVFTKVREFILRIKARIEKFLLARISVGGRETNLLLRPSGFVESGSTKAWIEWRYAVIPIAHVERTTVRRKTLRSFLEAIIGNMRHGFLAALCERASREFVELTRGAPNASFANMAGRYTQELKERMLQSLRAADPDVDKIARALLQEVCDGNLFRFKQEFVAGAGNVVGTLAENFRQTLVNELSTFKLAANAQGGGNLPLVAGTKFVVTQGNATVVVVEQKPQTRTIALARSFVASESDELEARETRKQQFRVSFPYLVFVFAFVSGKLARVRLFYRNETIGNLNDPIYLAGLPNIYEDGRICLGDVSIPADMEVPAIVETVIAHFWNSTFNGDITRNWNAVQAVDSRLANFWEWERSSGKDPRFPLSVDWPKYGRTLSWVVERFLAEFGGSNSEAEQFAVLVRRAIEAATVQLEQSIAAYCAGVKTENRFTVATRKILQAEIAKMAGLMAEGAAAGIEQFTTETQFRHDLAAAVEGTAEALAQSLEQRGKQVPFIAVPTQTMFRIMEDDGDGHTDGSTQ